MEIVRFVLLYQYFNALLQRNIGGNLQLKSWRGEAFKGNGAQRIPKRGNANNTDWNDRRKR